MKYADRNGNRMQTASGQDKLLKVLYTNVVGRAFLKVLTGPAVSKIGGMLLNTRISACYIPHFVKNNQIDLNLYEKKQFRSYNDFFTRTIKKEQRPIDMGKEVLIAPCDAKLTVYDIDADSHFTIKNTPYTVTTLLRDSKLAKKYSGGVALLFRLTVDDYHRYCYMDGGVKSHNRVINGKFHTVNPIANDFYPIYKENQREYCILRSEHFGDICVVEIGAMMVGKIVNHHQKAYVAKGEEKGYFAFGGSSIMVMLQKGSVTIDKDILDNTRDGYETKVKMGERIGIV